LEREGKEEDGRKRREKEEVGTILVIDDTK
jgi:hypothetical protein